MSGHILKDFDKNILLKIESGQDEQYKRYETICTYVFQKTSISTSTNKISTASLPYYIFADENGLRFYVDDRDYHKLEDFHVLEQQQTLSSQASLFSESWASVMFFEGLREAAGGSYIVNELYVFNYSKRQVYRIEIPAYSASSIDDIYLTEIGPNTTEGLYQGSATIFNGIIHMFYSNNMYTRQHFTLENNEWISHDDMPYSGHIYGKSIVYHNKIHVVGGWSTTYWPNAGSEHYTFDGSNWVEKNLLPFEFNSGYLCIYDDILYAFTRSSIGDSASTPNVNGNKYYKWDENNDSWIYLGYYECNNGQKLSNYCYIKSIPINLISCELVHQKMKTKPRFLFGSGYDLKINKKIRNGLISVSTGFVNSLTWESDIADSNININDLGDQLISINKEIILSNPNYQIYKMDKGEDKFIQNNYLPVETPFYNDFSYCLSQYQVQKVNLDDDGIKLDTPKLICFMGEGVQTTVNGVKVYSQDFKKDLWSQTGEYNGYYTTKSLKIVRTIYVPEWPGMTINVSDISLHPNTIFIIVYNNTDSKYQIYYYYEYLYIRSGYTTPTREIRFYTFLDYPNNDPQVADIYKNDLANYINESIYLNYPATIDGQLGHSAIHKFNYNFRNEQIIPAPVYNGRMFVYNNTIYCLGLYATYEDANNNIVDGYLYKLTNNDTTWEKITSEKCIGIPSRYYTVLDDEFHMFNEYSHVRLSFNTKNKYKNKRIKRAWVGDSNNLAKLVLTPTFKNEYESISNILPAGFETAPINFNAIPYNNELHIIGGYSDDYVNTDEDYSGFIKKATLPFSYVDDHFFVVFNGKLHCYGIEQTINNRMNPGYHYTYNGISWTQESDRIEVQRGCACEYQGNLHIFGDILTESQYWAFYHIVIDKNGNKTIKESTGYTTRHEKYMCTVYKDSIYFVDIYATKEIHIHVWKDGTFVKDINGPENYISQSSRLIPTSIMNNIYLLLVMPTKIYILNDDDTWSVLKSSISTNQLSVKDFNEKIITFDTNENVNIFTYDLS